MTSGNKRIVFNCFLNIFLILLHQEYYLLSLCYLAAKLYLGIVASLWIGLP